MNILYLLDNPQLYGSEIHLFDVLSYMAKEHSIYLVVFRNGPLIQKIKDEIPQVKICYIPSSYKIKNETLRQLLSFVKDNSIQIIHAHQPKAIFIGALVKIKLNIPYVVTIHSQPIDHSLMHNGFKKIIVFLFHSIIAFFGQLQADKIIYVSKYMLGKSFFQKKSILIYNWLRPWMEANKESLKKIKREKISFVSCGAVTYGKGFDILFTFVHKLICAGIENFEVKIAGGIDEEFLEKQKSCFPQCVFDKINFLGYLDNVTTLYKDADFFVLFSRAETFGLVYIEAMSFGLPIIAYDIPVLHEILFPENCITSNFDDAILFIKELIRDYQKYSTIYQENKNWVSTNFSYKKSMERLYLIYKEFINLR